MRKVLILSFIVLTLGCGGSDGSDESAPSDDSPSATNTQRLECGSSALYEALHPGCGAMDAVAAPDPELGSCFCFLGYAWDGSACVALNDCFCEGQDCDKLAETEEACLETHASCSSAGSLSPLACNDPGLFAGTHDACAPMDAAAAPDPELGSCFCFLGYAWDGSACVALNDCFCEGQDCDKLTQTQQDCETAHAACL
jgi:hypothetical protein